MTFNRRERIIMILALTAVFLLVADRYCVSPLLDQYARIQQTKNQLHADLAQNQATLQRKDLLQSQWKKMKQMPIWKSL